jgi:hypothetical protein
MASRKSFSIATFVVALLISWSLAATAAAEQRAYTCGTGTTFADAHCLRPGSGPFGLVEIPNSTPTSFALSSSKTASETTAGTPSQLSGTAAGVAVEIECSSVSGTGSLTNAASSVSGTGRLTYTGCVTLKPAGKGCKVSGGTINTEELKLTTIGQAANKLKIEQLGTRLANIKIEECSTTALNNTFPTTGSLVVSTNGATVASSKVEIETQNTLKFAGSKAGIGGALTVSDTGGSVVLK